jgi:hypothetical protein
MHLLSTLTAPGMNLMEKLHRMTTTGMLRLLLELDDFPANEEMNDVFAFCQRLKPRQVLAPTFQMF